MGSQFISKSFEILRIGGHFVSDLREPHFAVPILDFILFCIIHSRTEALQRRCILQLVQSFTETLEMDDFALAQEIYYIIDVRVIRYPQDVVIYGPRFLFSSQILDQIRDRIPSDSNAVCAVRHARCIRRKYTASMVHEICPKGTIFYFACRSIFNQLAYNRPNYFQMG